MATKRLNQAAMVMTIDILEKELHKDLKNYDEACDEERLQEAEISFELADDRMKRLITNYQSLIPLLEAEAQEKYLQQHEEFVNRFHKMSIDWRRRRPAESRRSPQQREPILQVAAQNEEETSPTTKMAPATNALTLQPTPNVMNISHLLPRIEISKFDGDLSKWRDWWAIFRTLIHENQTMRPIEKFSRLKLHITEEAAGAVSYLDLTEDNYNKAIDILNGKYNKPRSVKADHYIAITELKKVERQEDYKALRQLHDKAMGHALNLGNLEQSTAQNEAIMEIITRKLPMELMSRWHGKTKQSQKTLKDLFNFIDSIAEDWEYVYSTERHEKKKTKPEAPEKPQRVTFATTPTAAELAVTGTATEYPRHPKYRKQMNLEKRKCLFCNDKHPPTKCDVTLEKKIEQVKKEKRCWKCLGQNHTVKECWSISKCYKCGKDHHTAICNRAVNPKSVTATVAASPMLKVADDAPLSIEARLFGGVYVQTATVIVEGPKGWLKAIAYIDQGSNATLIRSELAQTLGLQEVGKINLKLQAVGHMHPEKERSVRKLRLRGLIPQAEEIELEAIEQPEIGKVAGSKKTEFVSELWSQGYQLADDRILSGRAGPCQIDVLIGANQVWKVLGSKQIVSKTGIRAIESKFGWLLLGQDETVTTSSNTAIGFLLKAKQGTPENLKAEIDPKTDEIDFARWWKLESLDPLEKIPLSIQWKSYSDTIVQDEDGHYVAPLPWNENKIRLSKNETMAEGQAKALIRRMDRDKEMKTSYEAEFEKLKVSKFISRADTSFGGIYTILPHHPVVRRDKTTSRVRPVFNGSAKPKTGFSANDCLEEGPNLNPDILDVMLLFRLNPIAWTADIRQAFLMVKLLKEDAEALRFYLEDEDVPGSLQLYKWNRLPFGLTCSPAVLRTVLKKHLESYEGELAESSQQILRHLYVDDYLSNASTLEETMAVIGTVLKLFADAKMDLRKWVTNNSELRRYLLKQNLTEDSANSHSCLNLDPQKVLGVRWNTSTDCFYFKSDVIVDAATKVKILTKRSFAKISTKLFDPLGLIGPVTLQFKLLFQELWQIKIGWDDEVPKETEIQFRDIVEDLKSIEKIQVPRMISLAPNKHMQELHIFCDASTKAYGAVAYAKSQYPNFVRLICCKTRAAPLPKNEVSLPRLELLSAELGSVLAERIVNAIDKVQWKVHLWTDSMATLGWIKGEPTRWKLFVRNRVEAIRKRSNPEQWRHCPGKDNPADYASRGTTVKKLIAASFWWGGPSWLIYNEKEWPQQGNLTSEEIQSMEIEARSKKRIESLAVSSTLDWFDVLAARASSYLRFLRTIAWMFRLFRKESLGKAIETVRGKEIPCLSVREIATAENFILKFIQKRAFPEIYESLQDGKPLGNMLCNLETLRPIWDAQDKLIRVTGRVGPALKELLIDPPILLPASEKIVDMMIQYHHVKRKHAGVQNTLTFLRNRFWIIRARQRIKSVIKQCVKCQKVQSRPFNEETASMPLDRTKRAQPFEVIGIDYFGPMYVLEEVILIEKDSEGNDVEKTRIGEKKVHACLFTCAVTRAVHLELVTDLTAQTFMHALRRMMSRREDCKIIYSDNASTFTCAAKLISEDPTLANWLSSKGITWKFSPSLAPWWGGFWERMVRSVKEPLRKVLGKMKVSYDQLHTILVEIEAIVNSRPLTYVSGDAQSFEVLSPQKLLTGRQPGATTESPDSTKMSRDELIELDKKRSEHALTWWRLWQDSYLSDLKRFYCRKGKGTRIPRVGEVVLLKEPNIKRVSWPTAIVTELVPGYDGKVRAVTLRLRSGKETTRGIQTVYPLEVQADIDTPVDEAEVGVKEKTTSKKKKKNPLRKKKSESQ
ncbi:uncharacterized protein LOC130690968 [Daphnia carinata]|uniref:uncharacterized protein LOC130690968 n=1 Tax=Daphnia carinata TaxID=120202 RepID=UPI0025796309|nr:uncharacterized protein LOC130690968 [Daphnia carinata]